MPQNFSLRTPDPNREQIMQEITQIAMIAMLKDGATHYVNGDGSILIRGDL